MTFPPDNIEKQIATVSQAWNLLNDELPQFKKLFELWKKWYDDLVKDNLLKDVIVDAMVISYARMALRNGSLSKHPLNYHNEVHIEDLLYRLMALSKFPASNNVPSYGWSLLSLFMCCHDLRQRESNINNLELIGNNEKASYQEVSRMLNNLDVYKVVRQEHKELLKLMIHGSTFGQGEDTLGNIYKGNLVQYILKNVGYFDVIDKELAYIACDIDTANVAANLNEYAQSSINVYSETLKYYNKDISAHSFFGRQQELYFFELQKFNSKLGISAFAQQKSENALKVKQISKKIKNLDANLSNEQIVEKYKFFVSELTNSC